MDEMLLANISDEQVDSILNDDNEQRIGELNRAIDKLEVDEKALITLFYLEE